KNDSSEVIVVRAPGALPVSRFMSRVRSPYPVDRSPSLRSQPNKAIRPRPSIAAIDIRILIVILLLLGVSDRDSHTPVETGTRIGVARVLKALNSPLFRLIRDDRPVLCPIPRREGLFEADAERIIRVDAEVGYPAVPR